MYPVSITTLPSNVTINLSGTEFAFGCRQTSKFVEPLTITQTHDGYA